MNPHRDSYIVKKIDGWYVTERMPGHKELSHGPLKSRADAYLTKADVDASFRQKLAMYQQALLLRQS